MNSMNEKKSEFPIFFSSLSSSSTSHRQKLINIALNMHITGENNWIRHFAWYPMLKANSKMFSYYLLCLPLVRLHCTLVHSFLSSSVACRRCRLSFLVFFMYVQYIFELWVFESLDFCDQINAQHSISLDCHALSTGNFMYAQLHGTQCCC